MKRLVLSALMVLTIGFTQAQYAFMEQRLLNRLGSATADELIPVILLIGDAVDMAALKKLMNEAKVPVTGRSKMVMSALKSKASSTQLSVVNFIESSNEPYEALQQFWISNSISLSANAALIQALTYLPEIAYIDLNPAEYGLVEPMKATGNTAKSIGGIEPGLAAIKAPEMWAMGYTGHGRIAMTFDTGVWPEHPTFGSRFLPNRMPLQSTWFGFDSPVPTDKPSSHGTHVSGIMLGLDTATADTIGVAPRAYFIATDPIVSNLAFVKPLSELMLGFEWSLNPDGDEDTFDDIPDVINNSWGRPNDIDDQDWGACSQFVIPVMAAVEAAGIANVFSAGNNGPGDQTISIPTNINMSLVNTFSVGALNGVGNGPWNIANFSSRGPSVCDGSGSLLIKPEVSAPGVNVRSAVANNEYDLFSGTSMASPHVSGAVLLLKEAFPYLTGEEILLSLYNSATDQGIPGEDNTFGMGMINVKAAFDYLALENDPVLPASPDVDLELVSVNEPTDAFRCSSVLNQSSITPKLTVRNNGLSSIEGITVSYESNQSLSGFYTDELFSLAPGATTQLILPELEIQGVGNIELHYSLATLPGEYDVLNNNGVKRWTQLPTADASDFYEEFESGIDPAIWTIYNPDAEISWNISDGIQSLKSSNPEGKSAWLNHPGYNLIASQKDWLMSPVIDQEFFDGGYTVEFDYFYRKRNNNDFQMDTLTVYAVHCAPDFNTQILFKAGGSDLWTNSNNLANAFPESVDDWQTVISENIDFYNFYIVFESTNRRGNNLLLDNISFPITSNTKKYPVIATTISPNPTSSHFNIRWSGNENTAKVAIFDVRGMLISQKGALQNNAAIDVSGLSQGVYLIETIFTDGARAVSKLMVE